MINKRNPWRIFNAIVSYRHGPSQPRKGMAIDIVSPPASTIRLRRVMCATPGHIGARAREQGAGLKRTERW